MSDRKPRVSAASLLVCAACLAAAACLVEGSRGRIPLPYRQQQVLAAGNMRRCIDALSRHPSVRPGPDDPNETNLIGIEYSPITTTLGDLEAKRTSTNPDFAALLVRWFHEAGLDSGDVVAVGCSGSFPALNIALLCAAEAMALRPVMIASVSASSYGANRPEFTYPDAETCLFEGGLLRHRSSAVSMGGHGDEASGLTEEGRVLLERAIRRSGIPRIDAEDRAENLCLRAEAYSRFGEPDGFVNIGGAWINVGGDDAVAGLHPGWNKRGGSSSRIPASMAEYYFRRDIPVFHLLNVKRIAREYGMPVDPVPLPEPGRGQVYSEREPSAGIWAVAGILVFGGWAILVRGRARIRPRR